MANRERPSITKLVGDPSRGSSYLGSLFTFNYTGKGATDKQPVVLVCSKNDNMVYKAKNGKRYIAGVNLNYTSSIVRTVLLSKFGKMNPVTYQDLRKIAVIAGEYRVYELSKVHHLSAIDVDWYISMYGEQVI